MGKHSREIEKQKKYLKGCLIAVFIIIVVIGSIFIVLNIKDNIAKSENSSIITSKTTERDKLVIKSKSDFNRVVEFSFENNILKMVKMYEQFEDKESFLEKKQNYEIADKILIININEQEMSIEIERRELGSDIGMSYDQIYNKYLVQMVGIYEII